jgi:hypothetical protein
MKLTISHDTNEAGSRPMSDLDAERMRTSGTRRIELAAPDRRPAPPRGPS